MKICFYYVDENYINYLKETEINVRGFTTVPNVRYSSRSKFVYGAVLEVNNVLYYVPVSHYNKDREYNLLIKKLSTCDYITQKPFICLLLRFDL